VTPFYAVLAGLVVLVGIPAVVAAAVLCPLVFFVPGYAMVTALNIPDESSFPWRRQVLAVTMSMASVVLGGLALNALFALTTTAWMLWLVGVTCVCWLAAVARNWHVLRSADASRPEKRRGIGRWSWPRWQPLVAIGAAALALAGAIAITEVSSRRAYDAPVTQLSMVSCHAVRCGSLRLSVTNLSNKNESVTLTVARLGRHRQELGLVIAPSQTWTREVPALSKSVTAFLTRRNDSQLISEVTWSADRGTKA
jgi:hypothetical protein